MPRKKKKYNARFPPARIKKIMQLDEDVGKVAAAVPVVISKALEMFVESLLTKSLQQTRARSAKTMSTSHIKQCIQSESTFDFLKDLVENVPDMQCDDDEGNAPIVAQPIERTHSQLRKSGRKRKNEEAGPSNSRLVKQSSEEPSTSEDDSESDDEEGTYNSDNNGISHDSRPVQIPSAARVPDSATEKAFTIPPIPAPNMGVFQAPVPPSDSVQTGMGVYRPSKNNTVDDDENYDT